MNKPGNMDKTARIYIAGHRGLVGLHIVCTPAPLKQADFTSAKRDALVKLAGFQTFERHE